MMSFDLDGPAMAPEIGNHDQHAPQMLAIRDVLRKSDVQRPPESVCAIAESYTHQYNGMMDVRTIRRHNLELLIAERGSVVNLARAAGVNHTYLYQIRAGFQGPADRNPRQIGDKLARAIETGLRLDYGWMDQPHDQNLGPGPELRGKVPLISWVQAGAVAESHDPFPPGVADEWVDTTAPIRQHTFALRVQGDSMEPDFPQGTVIVVEPMLEAAPGDYVIAKNGDGEATFKQLVKDAGVWYLKPLNPRYPIRSAENMQIVGVVREAIRRFR